jgi:hypothetical protein
LNEQVAASGLRGFWQKELKITQEQSKRSYIAPTVLARLHARLGDQEQAFDWLEQAYAERSPTLLDLKVDKLLDPLRPDPRFTDLLRRVGFAQ